MSSATTDHAPLAELDEWDDFVAMRYQQGKGRGRVSQLPRRCQAHGHRVLSAEPRQPDPRLRPRRRRPSSLPANARKMSIWEMEYLNTLVDDSDPDTDLSQIEHLMQTAEAIRGDGHPRWFDPHRPDPRPRQGPLPLRRAAVGGRRRHVPGRLRVLRQDRLPRVLRRQPRLQGPRVPDPVRHLRAELRAGQRPPLLGPRRVPLPRRQGLPARGGPVHDPLPLVLPGPPRRRVRHLMNDHDRADVRVGPQVQSLRPLLEGSRAAEREGNHALLPGPGRGVLPGPDKLVAS